MSVQTHLPSPHSPAFTSRTASGSYSAAENGNGPSSSSQRSPPSSPTHSQATLTSSRGGDHIMSIDRSPSRGSATISEGPGWKNLTPQRIGRAIGARFMRAAKRGNLPFLIIFFSCTIVFFSALAGIGYQEPLPVDSADVSTAPTVAAGEAGGFKFGGPVFDPANDKLHLERVMAEQRELEEAWARKRRPKDGAWMRKQRDDKAIRRVPNPTTKAAETLETAVADKGDNSAEAVVKRDEVSVATGVETKSAAAA
ncbi:hypothetical protein I312_100919 [Cryptococcus bacillisporus CA1280]|uniref:Uncharacterized protein n=1 Tax=Cryptococcus bacillisporus CA1280 TaxID=1296109 RepID=A0A0D0UAF8_CRYGA|nr:hypothetical protein I312_05555 [Cryptococcus bacillisporus CA1280]